MNDASMIRLQYPPTQWCYWAKVPISLNSSAVVMAAATKQRNRVGLCLWRFGVEIQLETSHPIHPSQRYFCGLECKSQMKRCIEQACMSVSSCWLWSAESIPGLRDLGSSNASTNDHRRDCSHVMFHDGKSHQVDDDGKLAINFQHRVQVQHSSLPSVAQESQVFLWQSSAIMTMWHVHSFLVICFKISKHTYQ